jgi:hypothetical protein
MVKPSYTKILWIQTLTHKDLMDPNPHTQEQGYRQLGGAAAQGERGRTVLEEARLSERGQICTHGSTDLVLGG